MMQPRISRTLPGFSRVLLGPVLALLVLCCAQTTWGQAVNATLLGTVTDSSGAAVANAKVVATESATGLFHESVTNESGNYTFPDMVPGTYAITAEAKGFKKTERTNIDLITNTSARVDLAVQPGDVAETVMVTTAPPELQTDRADISTAIEQTQISNLPPEQRQQFPIAAQYGAGHGARGLQQLAVL